LVAFLYACVGHAGATGYIALSRLGSRHLPVGWIRRCLAVVLLLAAWKLAGLGR
jgi:hypothetical protein